MEGLVRDCRGAFEAVGSFGEAAFYCWQVYLAWVWELGKDCSRSTAPCSVEKHSHGWSAEPQISPLRCAPVEMTKGRAVLRGTVVAEQKPFFITLGGPKAQTSSGPNEQNRLPLCPLPGKVEG
jgi:hypothetical protein